MSERAAGTTEDASTGVGETPRRPLRRPVGWVLAAAGAAYLAWTRDPLGSDGGADPDEPVSLTDLDTADLVATLPADIDPSDASEAIEDAIDQVRRFGRGGRVHLPPGDWVIGQPIRLDVPDLRLTGAGIRATRLRMAPGVVEHMVEVDADGVTVERLSLSGLGAEDPELAGHGVRVGSSARDLLLRDLLIEDMPSYGIGLQPRNAPVGDARIAGLFDGVCLRNVVIRRCGQDGIDVKNIDERIAACRSDDLDTVRRDCNGRRSFFRNLAVGQVGLRPGQDGEKPAIDLRGIRSLQNIEMVGLADGGFGARFRNDEAGPPNGLGGSGSTLENFLVMQTDGGAPGVERSGTEGVEVHNGFVVEGTEVEAVA